MPDLKGRVWGLRARLLGPVIGLAIVTAVILSAIGDFSARRQAEALVDQRGTVVLQGIADRVADRQRSKEVFARLLADDPGVISAVEGDDRVALAQALVPLKTELDLGFVEVYGEDERQMMRLGESEEEAHDALLGPSFSGLNRSTSVVGEEGLEIYASAPIKGSQGIVGVMLVGTTLDGEALQEVKVRDDMELAVYREGRLVSTSATRPDLRRMLDEHRVARGGLEELNRDLKDIRFDAVAKPMGDGGQMLAFFQTRDLELAARRRNLMVLASSLVLMGALLTVVLLLSRSIVRPIGTMIGATGDMVRGNYDRRVATSRIRELDDLWGAINNLARQLKIQVSTLSYQAFHDSLTGLPNRALFMDRIGHALTRAARHGKFVGVLLLDLDNFKLLNDSMGHLAGDRLLVAVAERMRASVRPEDTVARLGGDEFTFLLEDADDLSDAVRVAERVSEELRKPFLLDGHEVFATASIGIAMSNPGDRGRSEDLLRNADIALYKAKGEGKAHHAVYDVKMHPQAWERLRAESELRQAIVEEQLRVHYQPKMDLGTGGIVGFEALVRWEHPERGIILPLEFVPLAEETGLIVPIGEWVLRESCLQARQWREEHPVFDDPAPTISVNLSPRQLQQKDFTRRVAGILRETGLDPGGLSLEITESVLMKDAERAIEIFGSLKDLGVGLEVDDFGTGYSSLAYLKRFPVDYLKVDKSFVDGLGEDPEDTAIVSATISMAHALGLKVIAEGVETTGQLALLCDMGCDTGQGYYFSQPLPPSAAGELLRSVVSSSAARDEG